MDKLPIERSLGQDCIYANGLLTTQWANVEELIRLATIRLVDGHENRTMVLVNGMQFKTNLDFLDTLIKLHIQTERPDDYDTLTRKFASLGRRLNKIHDKRNLFAHSIIMEGDKPRTYVPLKITTRRGVKSHQSAWTTKDIHDVCHRMYGLVGEFSAFFNEAGIDLQLGTHIGPQ